MHPMLQFLEKITPAYSIRNRKSVNLKKSLFVLVLLSAIFLSACGVEKIPLKVTEVGAISPSPVQVQAFQQTTAEPTPLPLHAGLGGITGRVAAAAEIWPDETQLFIWAAPFYGKNGEGFYTLEPSMHPSTRLNQGGTFQMNTIPPGSYVLVVGPAAEEGKLIVDNNGKPFVIVVQTDRVNDLGDLTLAQ
jgi:hypothetical protein